MTLTRLSGKTLATQEHTAGQTNMLPDIARNKVDKIDLLSHWKAQESTKIRTMCQLTWHPNARFGKNKLDGTGLDVASCARLG